MNYEDILVEHAAGVAWLTINRPRVLNAFRGTTVDELIHALRAAWHDETIGVVVLNDDHRKPLDFPTVEHAWPTVHGRPWAKALPPHMPDALYAFRMERY
jgi:hypothetical protein